MRIICTGCGIPLDPVPGKVKRSCPACGFWTDYRHLLARNAGQDKKKVDTPTGGALPFSGGASVTSPDKEKSATAPSGDAVLDQLMDRESANSTREGTDSSAPLPANPSPKNDNITTLLVQPKKSGEDYSSSEDPDDSLPYAITNNGDIFCPQCDQRLPADAILCIQCGLNFQTGEKVRRAHKVVQLHWVESMAPTTRRLLAFLWSGALLATFATLYQLGSVTLGAAIGWSLFAIPQVCVLLGSYGELALTRNRKGQVKIARLFRIGFISLGEKQYLPEGHEGIKCSLLASMGIFEWVVMIFLLVPTLLSGIVFYFLVMHRPYVVVSLTRHTGRDEVILFRTREESQGREIAQTLHKIIGKPLDYSA